MAVLCRVLAVLLAAMAFAAGATNDSDLVKVCGIGLAAVALAVLGQTDWTRRPDAEVGPDPGEQSRAA